jgi:hypothetical protein
MRADRTTRGLAVAALVAATLSLVLSGYAALGRREHDRQVEALGDLMRRAAATGRPVMDMGPPGGGRAELDRGD